MNAVPSAPTQAWIIQTCPDCGLPFRTPVAGKKCYATVCIDCAEGDKSSGLRLAAHAISDAMRAKA